MNNIEDKYPTLITLKGLGVPEASFGRDKKIKVSYLHRQLTLRLDLHLQNPIIILKGYDLSYPSLLRT